MPDSPVLDVAIALALIFAVFAGMTSAVTEAISRFLGLRADYLVRGIRSLVLGASTAGKTPTSGAAVRTRAAGHEAADAQTNARALLTALLNDGVVSTQGAQHIGALAGDVTADAGAVSRKALRAMPSYLSSRAFAQAVVGYLIPDDAGDTSFATLETTIGTLPEPFKSALTTLAKNADNDVAKFRTLVEGWYDDHMDRVSGWYKRHVRWFSLGCGALLVVLFNVNTIGVAQAVYSSRAIQSAVVAEAVTAAPCPTAKATPGTTEPAIPTACLNKGQQEISKLHGIGIPLGWTGAQEPSKDFGQWFWRVVGWVLTALALTLGARFWFDALGRLGTLRSSGAPPAKSTAG